MRVTLADFLTPSEIGRAAEMWNESRDNYAARVDAELITPNMARINASLGQENDARFLAYAVEYVMGAAAYYDDNAKKGGKANV